ncbi:MAG: hypothetical protein IJP90_06375 [Treponema sp.]|nr:hypothetical protein [Treponema sp.]MBR0099325.1 hypothetical protein [Treponema sp.]
MTGLPQNAQEPQNVATASFQKYRSFVNTMEHLDENTRQAIIELAEKLKK